MSVDLKQLEQHLTSKSYIDSYIPSQADVHVYSTLGSAPDASAYPHASRWYSHIKSYEAEHSTLPGDKTPGETFTNGASTSAAAPAEAAEDDELDLFGDDDEEEDAEAEKVKAERVAAYNLKKAASSKPKTIAKSVVTFDVKPWDDETDMDKLEAAVRSVEKDGLVWGLSKFVPLGYGIRKLQITVVIEDEKISLDELQETVEQFEDFVQSTDIAAMQSTCHTCFQREFRN
ncbi:hypothetical protein FIBSPDRAFT_811424 [Athelia psychrophila]|uniref:Elongation factor 1-beta n=1 Tax=Athelia psychrophila TaxID=1759441 RepID=A0A166W0S5_9AGAM|nr:hypothetical protein FIBSPDRAFT_811424 [Fibularhizoctonia sp. CBS 109695]